mgnify:FL=1
MSSNVDSKENKKIKIALVAGEESGDQLGASLIKDLKRIFPSSSFIGVGGRRMQQEGLDSFFEMRKISVMGIIEPLLKISELLTLRKKLKEYLSAEAPDIFIGIDSPDFNLAISRHLKMQKIKTVQYVSPSIWAWRKGRIKTIEKSVDKVLTLFPFELLAYSESSVEASFVGHPLAHKIPRVLNKESIRNTKFHLNEGKKMIALLPGSRKSEVKMIGEVLLKTAKLIKELEENACFFMPLADIGHKELIPNWQDYPWVNFSEKNAQDVLAGSHLGIVTSGTASLEAALFKTPVVVVYKTSWITYLLVKPLLRIKQFSLPNLLAGSSILPELLQYEVTDKNLFNAYKDLENNFSFDNSIAPFEKIHLELIADGPDTAAKVIADMI